VRAIDRAVELVDELEQAREANVRQVDREAVTAELAIAFALIAIEGRLVELIDATDPPRIIG
jgi:hypothetical protein